MLMIPENDDETLSHFGLTRNQAKVYITVVRLGLASVGQVAKVSKVRREDVYRIIPKLEKMGLIERMLGTPTKIRATPIEDALSILVKQEQERAKRKVSELIAEKDAFLRRFNSNKGKLRFEGEEAQFALLQGDLIVNKIINMIRAAEKEIDVMTTRESAIRFAQTYTEQLEKAIKHGVRIRILSEMPEYEDLLLKIVQNSTRRKTILELKCLDDLHCQCIIVDYKQILIATSKEAILENSGSLWTNNESLVGIMQRNFEDSWHNAISIKAIETEAVSEKVSRFINELKPTTHAILVYDSVEAKHNILFNYLKAGLENGEVTVYVTTEETPNEIRHAMRRFGIDTKKYEKAGALRILEYSELYIINGKFNVVTTIGLWNKMFNEALAKGFKGMRVTGEMTCFFEQNLLEELLEYEKALHRFLDVPMIAICAYNSSFLNRASNPVNLYMELVRAHGTILFSGIDKTIGRIQIRKA